MSNALELPTDPEADVQTSRQLLKEAGRLLAEVDELLNIRSVPDIVRDSENQTIPVPASQPL